MDYSTKSYNDGKEVALQSDFNDEWLDFCKITENISDEEIISTFESRVNGGNTEKSISKSLNHLFDKKLKSTEWISKQFIFKDRNFKKAAWSLDYYKGKTALEISFHHEAAITWKLMKSVLANQPNEIRKNFDIGLGIFVFATDEMREVGGFDPGIITFEKAENYATALSNFLTFPIIFIGLEAPITFHIKHFKDDLKNRNVGKIVRRL